MKKRLISVILVCAMALGIFGFSQLPVFADTPAEEEIFDDLADFSMVDAEKSTLANLGFATTSQVNLTDSTRIYKLNDMGETEEETLNLDTKTQITYYSEYAITDYTVTAAVLKTKNDGLFTADYKIAVSADGENFTELEKDTDFTITISSNGVKEDGTPQWGNNAWRQPVIQSIAPLPDGIKYFRIYLPSTVALRADSSASASYRFAQISNVKLIRLYPAAKKLENCIAAAEEMLSGVTVGDEAGMYPEAAFAAITNAVNSAKAVLAAPDVSDEDILAALETLKQAVSDFEASEIKPLVQHWKDECNDASKIVGSFGIAFKVAGDFKSIVDSDGQTGDSSFSRDSKLSSQTEGNYAAYEVSEESRITNINVETAYLKKSKDNGDMRFFAAPASESGSEADAVYTELTYTKEHFGNVANKWDRYRYTVASAPKNTKYIKVEVGNTGKTAYSIQVTKVEWDVNFKSAGNVSLNNDYDVTKSIKDGKAEFNVRYFGGSAKVYLIYAEYKDGRLTKTTVKAQECASDSTVITSDTITPENGSDFKVMLWDGTSLSPLVSPVEKL